MHSIPAPAIIAFMEVLVFVAVVGVMLRRQRTDGRAVFVVLDRVGLAEERLREELDRSRTTLEGLVRESLSAAQEKQGRLLLDLRANLERVRDETKLAIADRFAQAQGAQQSAMLAARRSQDERLDRIEAASRELTFTLREALGQLSAGLHAASRANAAEVGEVLAQLRESEAAAFTRLQERLDIRLEEVRRDNAEHLERIRATVDDKLHSALETRLGESFRLVSERLEQLHKSFGEMQEIAHGVGDLRRVLTNVRTRGTFGEVQLATLLEQVLTPDQYATNVATVPERSERVEFAIKLPGRDRGPSPVLLPIDAKFPLEDYHRLQHAYDEADAAAIDAGRKALRSCLLRQAQAIREKYVSPPHTTDFALMFLPTEGLYAETLRIPGMTEELQTQCRVVPVGPTTLYAVLSSLQIGFRTLAIERRSSEVWTILGAVKTEFERFGASLEAVSKKLQEAGNKIAETSQRTRAMKRKLHFVEALPDEQAACLFVTPGPGKCG